MNVTDVASAENAFVNNTNNVVNALNARARAAALAALQQEMYEKALRLEVKADILQANRRRIVERQLRDRTKDVYPRGVSTVKANDMDA
mgnify:FL=1